MRESNSFNKVLLAINVRWWNAEAAYAINLARGLVARGIKVWVIVNPGSPVYHKAEKYGLQTITDIYLDSRSLVVQYKNLKKLLCIIDRFKIELINSFKSNGAILFSIARRYRPGLIYVKTRGIASPPKNHFINRRLYDKRSCDGIITVGSLVQGWMKGLLPNKSDQLVKTIYYGDSAVIDTKKRNEQLIEPEFTVPKNKKVFALVGRIQPIKGHMLLLRALKQLEQLPIHVLFLVKNLQEFPDVLEEINDYININKLTEKVSILGFQKDLGRLLSKVYCGVIPSLDSEVNCRVCVEFFSARIPVIAFPTGTLPDIISHLNNGYLCSDQSVLDLVKGMRWAMEHEVAIEKAKNQALTDYHEKYTLEKLSEETLLFYQQCKNGRSQYNGMDDELIFS